MLILSLTTSAFNTTFNIISAPSRNPTLITQPMTEPFNGFSIDLEDWFQVGNLRRAIPVESWDSQESRIGRNTDKLLTLLERTGCRSTFFVLGWIAARNPSLIQRIAEAGHEIASHGSNHVDLQSHTAQTLAQELRDEKSRLEDLTGRAVIGFRAPNFSIVRGTAWALEALSAAGFKYDSSVMPVRRGVYGVPGNPLEPYWIKSVDSDRILEVAPSVISLLSVHVAVGGGGYFRLWPYAFTRWAALRITREGRPFCFYIHPWEIDPTQPRPTGLKPFSEFKHYHNLDATLERLERLLNEFRFSTYQSVANATMNSPFPLPLIQI
jgi:polysaccharide deacetylase family protein (PEP-CTERM system associated)